MKNKKIIMYAVILLILLILFVVGFTIYINIKVNKEKLELEYIPQEEISDEQLRKTVVSLYFLDMDNYCLAPETREIDSKELINDPYDVLINLLIAGPENNKLLKLIPDNTKLNSVNLENGILYIDFSEEFVKDQALGVKQEKLILNSIVNTLTELTEINQVAILINGQQSGFPDGAITFNKPFVRGN